MGLDMYLSDVDGDCFGSWRKANQIHGWIVDKFANGIDNCEEIEIPRTGLIELKQLCEIVLTDNSLALKLLPPREGFFFGSYDIDNYYFDDLRDTLEIIDFALQSTADTFIYQASW